MQDNKKLKKIPGFIVNVNLVKKNYPQEKLYPQQTLQGNYANQQNINSYNKNYPNINNQSSDSEQDDILPNRYKKVQTKKNSQFKKQFNNKPFLYDFPNRYYYTTEDNLQALAANQYQVFQRIALDKGQKLLHPTKQTQKNKPAQKLQKQEAYKSLVPVTHSNTQKTIKSNSLARSRGLLEIQQISKPSPEELPVSQPFVQYDYQQMMNRETYQNLQNIQLNLNDVLSPQQAMSTVEQLLDQIGGGNSDKQKEQVKERLASLTLNPIQVVFADRIPKKTTPIDFPLDALCSTYSLLKTIDTSIRQLSFQQQNKNFNRVFQSLRNYIVEKSQAPIIEFGSLKLADNKKQLIKKSIICEKISIILIGFCLSHQILKSNRNYILNLIKFNIDSNLFFLSQLIKSQELYLLIKFYYPYLDKQISNSNSLCEFKVMKHGNQLINQIFMKMSLLDSIFFGTVSMIIKECKYQPILTTFKQLLGYLAYYINSQGLTKNSNFLSTFPSPFIKKQQVQTLQKPYLVLDPSDFYYKTAKRQIQFRPFTQYFLKEMNKYFNLISMSNWCPKQANKVMCQFDKNAFIQHHFYSHHYQRRYQDDNLQNGQQVYLSKCQTLIKNSLLFGPTIQNLYFLTTIQRAKTQKIINLSQENIFYLQQWRITNKSDRKLVQICPRILLRIKRNPKCQLN